ncbi:TonB-dependent receptor [Mucilaginibacter gynuensis]|uniref:TonB-dependent receptor n=1 Tax=Mucilaginibacter gynuensis TaxID=1302236 RepID=A0ABP8FVK9_9SPHI
MKLVTILLFTGILQIHATAFSQNVYSFNLNNITVKEMFKQIEKNSNYTVFYRLDQVNVDQKIQLTVQDASIETVMKQVLQKQHLAFKVIGDIIIIKPGDDKDISALTVTGAVTSESGETLPGVSVSLKGSELGTTTDASGKYSITIPDGSGTLIFTYIGYSSQQVAVNGQTVINVKLKEEAKALNEVVVVGYSTQRKKDLTGAVSVVDVKNLNKTASSSVNTQLQGQASGVSVIGSGQPGEEPQVRIRGFNTFGNNTPLYVVDGVPTQDVSTLNPNDVETFQILKDASSASIYGARASNGVIIITTKKGKGKVNVQYDAYYGSQVPKGGNVWNTLNPQEMADLKRVAKTNHGDTDFSDDLYGNGAKYVLPDYIFPTGAMAGDPSVDPSKYYVNPYYTSPDDLNSFYRIVKANKAGTDWYHAIFKTAPITSHNLSVSGGSDQGSYLFSLNYFNQRGTLIETYQKRYTLRSNSSYNISKNIRIGENLAYSITSNPKVGGNDPDGVITMAIRQMPIIPVYDIMGNYAGSYGSGLGDANNPVAIQQRTRTSGQTDYRLFGNMFAEADIIKGLTLRTSFGGETSSGNSHYFTYPSYENVENQSRNGYNEDSYSNYVYNWTNTLSYHKTIDKHDIKILVGTESNQENYSSLGGSRQNYYTFDPNYVNLSTGDAAGQNNYSDRSSTSLFSEFARLDYIFNDKYLFNATIRHDGTSNFSKNKQYGYFPAFSLGWRISQENFMKSLTWLNDLKIRGGYGIMGNQLNLTNANRFDTFSSTIGQSYYAIGGDGVITPGYYQAHIGNADARWEKDANTNIGFDATILNNALSFTIDYYRKDIRDLLFNPELLGTAGNGEVPYRNIAKMKTDGLDASVTGNFKISKDFTFNSTLTLTTYNNKIIKLSDNTNNFPSDIARRFGTSFVRNEVGHSVGEFYGYKIAGFWNSQDEIDAADAHAKAVTGNPDEFFQQDVKPGRFRYVDVNGDGLITDADKTFLGNPSPKFSGGLNLGGTYKNFDFNILLYGTFGNKVWNNVKYWRDFYANYETAKSKTALYDSWTPDNHNAKAPIQELDASFSSGSVPNSYFVENGTYLRARNAQIGYTFGGEWLKKANIQKLHVYVSATNLFTITGYSGIDPELNGGVTNFGIDEGSYATPRTFLFGVNFSL